MATPAVPDWMTTAFFQSCLQGHETQPLTVTNYTIKPLDIPDGSYYSSQLFRVLVDYIIGDTKSSISFVVKQPLADREQSSEAHEREVKFYSKFVNETYKYSEHDLLPKHYNSPNPRIVVLEDLNISGYVMVDRRDFLDLEHCQLAIKAYAKLHALSITVYKENPEIIESLVKTNPTPAGNAGSKKPGKLIMEGGLRCTVAFLEDSSNDKEYLDIIKEVSKNDNLWEMVQEVEKSSANKPLKALVQLDPWCTNMLFKYDSLGKVENVKLLDFQNIAFISPLKSIVSFMSLCPNLEVRKTHLNDLYDLYIDTLNENLAELGCSDRLNVEAAKAEIASMAPLVLHINCSSVPTLLTEHVPDIKDYFSDSTVNGPIRESPIYKFYQSETVTKVFSQFLDSAAKEGVFDYVKEKLKQI